MMNESIQVIPIARLILAFIPVVVVVGILIKWSLDFGNAAYAVSRMLVQLLLVGYVLTYIFDSDSAAIVVGVLAVMVAASSWIALRTTETGRSGLLLASFVSILIGGGITLVVVTQGVVNLDPWYSPRFMIPLAGMIFANAMNSVSLAAERFEAETKRGVEYEEARGIALKTSLIPITNSLFAVGLVSLPGMMTGQILSGVSPFVAARYQIMVMCMVYGSAGISSALFLVMIKSKMKDAVAS